MRARYAGRVTEQPSVVRAAALVRKGDMVETMGGQWRKLMEVDHAAVEGDFVRLSGRNGEAWEMEAQKKLRFLVVGGHSMRVSRPQRGRGAIKGAGMMYGTHLRCSCGHEGRVNAAPGKVGREMMKRHLEAVMAAREKEGLEAPGLA